ncbi:MAG: hypothetical protein ACO29V_03325 [Limnohabitans sp.]
MKFSAALFHQTPADIQARLGDRFNPATNYPAYDGVMSVPATLVPELIEYLTAAQPNDRGEIPLKLAGWKKTSQSGKTYLSIQVSEDYRTQKAIEAARAQAAAAPAPSPVAAAAQQLAANFGGQVVPAEEDVPF